MASEGRGRGEPTGRGQRPGEAAPKTKIITLGRGWGGENNYLPEDHHNQGCTGYKDRYYENTKRASEELKTL
jgi:hypothetical protein